MATRPKSETKIGAKQIVLAAGALLILIQLVPYGRNHENPPVLAEPPWDSPQTRETFYQVCGDCHSNTTEWPWYSSIAPASWLVASDVEEARSHLNVSEWGRGENHADEAAEEVEDGEMPLWYYLPLHPEARLTEVEKEAFVRGLVATFGREDDH
jgi:hypothetical protein